MTENLITQQEVQDYAPDLDLSQFSPATISGMISRASQRVKNFCEVDGFFKAAVTNERDRVKLNTNGELVISFKRRPVAAGDISAIRLVQTDVSQSLTLQNETQRYYFIPDPGTYMIYPSNFLVSHGIGLMSIRSSDLLYEIDYTGGYTTDIADIPPDLKEATTLYLRSIVNKRLNPSGASSFSQGAVSMGFSGNKSGKDQLVQEAENILNDGGYVRQVIT